MKSEHRRFSDQRDSIVTNRSRTRWVAPVGVESTARRVAMRLSLRAWHIVVIAVFLCGATLVPDVLASSPVAIAVHHATANLPAASRSAGLAAPPSTLLIARPGGGSSFSGGSRSSSGSSRSSSSGSSSRSSSSSHSSSGSGSRSSGGDSGSGDLFGLIGLLLSTGIGGFGFFGLIVLLIVVSQLAKARAASLEWHAGAGTASPPREPIRRRLEALRTKDPNFSLILFEDFLYALYAETHTHRGAGTLERLSPFLKAPARASLTALGNVRHVGTIVVGAMRYRTVDGMNNDGPTVWVSVEFEANYTETNGAGAEQSFYACEHWMLSRAKATLSRTPDRVRVFTCPQCGAPLDTVTGGKCQYCQAVVDTGQFDWVVETIETPSREERGPMLTGTTEEQGTNLVTVFDPDVASRFAELSQRDPALAWPALQARVGVIFLAMQASWSNRDGTAIRAYVSDNLFQMLAYWIATYKSARLRNVTEGARIEQMQLVRVASDKFFDALTVRIFASSLDYTITDEDGRVVGGSRSSPRRYSEYWTLIRSVARQGNARSDANCPSCGAPLQIEMAGTCVYCRAKVTSGEFDWVLSRIEQDEVYDG